MQLVLTGIVLTHLAVNLAHGFAHARANVALSRSSMLFVLLVILVGPSWAWSCNASPHRRLVSGSSQSLWLGRSRSAWRIIF